MSESNTWKLAGVFNSMPLMHWIRSIKPEVKCSRYLTQRSGGLIGKRIRNEMGLLAPKILPRQHVHSDIKEVVKPFDWSYSTDYKGSIFSKQPLDDNTQESPAFRTTDRKLPLRLLSQPDPILFFSSIDLFEDELADNGMSLLTVKVRVMPRRLLLLSFWRRLWHRRWNRRIYSLRSILIWKCCRWRLIWRVAFR